MVKMLCAILFATITTGSYTSARSAPIAKPIVLLPSSITWMPGSGALPPTAGIAVLEGDPSKNGEYTIRLRLPNAMKFPPHWYDQEDRITVISGTLEAGIGSRFDSSKLIALTPGSYAAIPAFVRHFAVAKGVTIVQISARGPRHIWFVRPH